jgi:hypothetical protein
VKSQEFGLSAYQQFTRLQIERCLRCEVRGKKCLERGGFNGLGHKGLFAQWL